MTKTCETCRWWVNDQNCRRFPPQMALWPIGNQSPIVYEPFPTWAYTKSDDWCGEHQPKETTDAG